MKSFNFKSMFKAAMVAVAAMVAFSVPSQAQAVANGKFTLTHETYWSGAVLPAGDYMFSVEYSSSPARVIVRKVDGASVAILIPQALSMPEASETSRLILERKGEMLYVSDLYVGQIGLVLHYSAPRPKPALELARVGAPSAGGK